jgi:DNA invertase Pin-like site-specific DNA recombinase
MPKRKERMAGYIRESDPSLADSTTIESQAKAVRQYAEREGYIYDTAVYEYKEAISAYMVPYMERPVLQKLLEAAKRREFDVLVVNEVRAISRRQVEVFIIYDMLQRYGVRLETVKEKFEDDAMGRLILGLRAAYAEIEREQSYVRLQRGKKDRIEIGQAPPNGHRCYGYILVDTEREVKGRYEFNHEIIYVDKEGTAWSEYKVRVYVLDLLKEGESLHGTANRLNDLGIPPPRKSRKGRGCWTATTVQRIAESRMNIGEVWVNRYARVGKRLVTRPQDQWILLPEGTAPAIIDEETFDEIQRKVKHNKQDSVRNNQHREELGLLRSGYIFCGICGRRMILKYPGGEAALKNYNTPVYRCQQKDGKTVDITHNHRTQIHVPGIDAVAIQKIIEVLQNPEEVREQVEVWRQKQKPVFDSSDIEATIENIHRSMQNLFTLAQNATEDETLANLAIRILGIRVTVFPSTGDWPFRYDVIATVPEIINKLAFLSQTSRRL